MKYPATELIPMAEYFLPQRKDASARWELCLHQDKKFLYPCDLPDNLFRGQIKRCQPCLPALCRGTMTSRSPLYEFSIEVQVEYIIRVARSWMFVFEIDKHPALKWADENEIVIDEYAIAQHYGFATNLFDATQSFAVAAFFATCVQEGSGWRPATKKDGTGIIYKLDWKSAAEGFFEPIGLQVFPRPEQQWAWSIDSNHGADLERAPWVSYVEFDHDVEVSRYFYEMFDGGLALFPHDPLNIVAKNILESKVIWSHILGKVIDNLSSQQLGIEPKSSELLRNEIEKIIPVTNDDPQFIDPYLPEMKSLWASCKDDFAKEVIVRPIALRVLPP